MSRLHRHRHVMGRLGARRDESAPVYTWAMIFAMSEDEAHALARAHDIEPGEFAGLMELKSAIWQKVKA